jgi:hypothetical protein
MPTLYISYAKVSQWATLYWDFMTWQLANLRELSFSLILDILG